ncbi:LysR family transcriptional regulator [Desulfoscipio geothermicus]|uniref:Regulatory helix-turn-helix protein, lysR family n=1 Tax=Desulfoscipio geothermicus DSM 3669 TaxID=1121426 RepID=A0A1I6CTE9_9FIRM|nr:LysR family transcriptional regulator [Desulfoscipio geothermicus]SFQ96436.1 regulatory helix-turn-helix protein, lysR family [Desulfoscipio geothermicus DSM 3669]
MAELNLYHLKTFYAVARHLNYSRAGEELALSQPAVSRQVAALEKTLEHPLAGRNVTAADLAEETLLWREKGSAARALVESFLDEEGISFKKTAEISDAGAIKRLATEQVGVAFLPKHAVELELAAGVLRVVDHNRLAVPVYCSIISVKDMHSYPAVLAFLNFVRKWATGHY